MPFLSSDRIELRPLEKSDLDGPYAEWINSQETDIFSDHARFAHSRQDLERYFQDRIASQQHIWLAIVERESGCHIGNIELSDIDWIHRKAKYAIIIGDRKVEGKGYGFEASILLLRHAFEKLNLHRLELGVHEGNIAGKRLYEKLGFVEEGRLRQAFLRNGRYHDVIIMGLLADDFFKLHCSE